MNCIKISFRNVFTVLLILSTGALVCWGAEEPPVIDKQQVAKQQVMDTLSKAISNPRNYGPCLMMHTIKNHEAEIKDKDITQLIDLLNEKATGCLDEVALTLLRMKHTEAVYALILVLEPAPDKIEKFSLTAAYSYYPKVLETLLGEKLFERGAAEDEEWVAFSQYLTESYTPLTHEKWLEVKNAWLDGRERYDFPISASEIEEIMAKVSKINEEYYKYYQEAVGPE